MDDTSVLLDSFGIACATLRLDRGDGGNVRRLSLLDCNEAFTEQTALDDSIGERFLREAFGVGATVALGEFVEASEGRRTVFPHFYRSSSRWFSCYAQPVNGNELSVALVDVTDYRADSALMQLREQAYRYFIEHLPMIAFLRIVSPHPHSLFTAGSFREITGYGPEQGSSIDTWIEIVHPDDKAMVAEAAEELSKDPAYEAEIEYRIVRLDGQIRWVHSYDRQFTSDDGTTQIVQGLIMDVTERKNQEEALREANERISEQNRLLARLARTDVLTGLLNRRAMQEQLERELRLLSRGRGTFSILLIDLDDFKSVNDIHGHRAGDRVLMHLSETLGEQLRASDVQARWGGEEFMVLFSGTGVASAKRVAAKLLAWFREHPTVIDGDPLPVTFTAGLVEAVEGDTVDTLFARADKALYQGKNAGRNRIVELT